MLRLDYEQLDASAKKLMEEMEAFDACISNMTAVVSNLPDIWEAQTCDRYVEQFEELKPGFESTRDLIGEMSEQMSKIAQNFADADSDMAGQM